MARKIKPPEFGPYLILCPYCLEESKHGISSDNSHLFCPKCHREFKTFLTTVRAKRGRRETFCREYIIRYVGHSGEGVLEIRDAGFSDLDIRSSDLIYVCYKKETTSHYYDTPTILGNLTIKEGVIISKPIIPKR